MSRRLALASLVGVVLVAGIVTPLLTASARERGTRPNRVLVFSLPHVSWANLELTRLPNLNRLLDTSAIAALTTRAEDRVTRLADGYLTLGAGTRAVGDTLTDGDNLGVNERFGGTTAGDAFHARTGRRVRHGIVSLAESRIIERNDDSLYNAEIGVLAVALREAGYRRAVIANGDGLQTDVPPPVGTSRLRRQAALALTDPVGRLPYGRVDERLLQKDPGVAFGQRLNQRRVVQAFEQQWRNRSVVLVEASDLVRADAYREVVTKTRGDQLLADALQKTDRLLGKLLEHVNLRRDAVIVMGPAHSVSEISLTVLGVHTPKGKSGLLESATTRRPGFVQLIDVGPTMLELLNVDRPTSMEGRPAIVEDTGGSAKDRRHMLIRADEAAIFRDDLVGVTQLAFVLLAGALVAATIAIFRARPGDRARELLGRAALTLLGFVPAVYLTRLVPLDKAGLAAYWAYLVVVALGIGALYHRCGRGNPLDAILVALLANIALFSADVVFGSVLQFNSALGYSPTVAGRFVGFSNPAYAALGASSVIAAPLLARRMGPPRGLPVALGLLAVVVFIDGAPFWGSDVGGILSMVPAFGITAALMVGWKIRGRTVLWCLIGLVLALVAFAALDLARPAEERTHLGRLLERIDENGLDDFIVVLHRKVVHNVATLTNAIWGFMLPIALVFWWWLVRRVPDRARAVLRAVPELRTSAIGFAILAILGCVLNDSGVAIPAMMLAIALGCAVWLLATVEPETRRPAKRGANARAARAR